MSVTHLIFDGPVATFSLDFPVGNRINFEMRREMLDAFQRVATSDARALIVRADGDDFCLGGDVREWPGMPANQLRPKIEVFAKALDQLSQLQIPTVAAVQGLCLGGGFELVLSCDLILATEAAQFGCPEALLGIVTLQGGVLELARRIGRTRAIELAFLSEPAGAAEMARLNLVNRVVPNGDLGRETESLAKRLAAGPARAYAATKTLLRAWSAGGVSGAKDVLYDISMPLFETEEVQTALRGAANAAREGRAYPGGIFSSAVEG